jgi:hypothetical protein
MLQSAALVSPDLQAWKSAGFHPVNDIAERHAIHSYFNTCPESPDGRSVLYFTSAAIDGESGDIRVFDRSGGKEKIVASGIVTEDAHRVACQQWFSNGRVVAWHNYDPQTGRWSVCAADLVSGGQKTLVEDRQLGFGSATGDWAPVYGCHWNPGTHRDLELVNVRTGEIRTPVTIGDVLRQYGSEIEQLLPGGGNVSIFFPVLSPDGQRVIFKLARGNGNGDSDSGGGGGGFRSRGASKREGMIVYDLTARRFLGFFKEWGHPSWMPDSKKILQKKGIRQGGTVLIDLTDGSESLLVPGAAANHPAMSPVQALYVTDANIAWKKGGRPGEWGIFVVSPAAKEFTIIHRFPFRDKGLGAQSWRLPDPHPVFSADGKRIYFNVNDGPWTRLWVGVIESGGERRSH